MLGRRGNGRQWRKYNILIYIYIIYICIFTIYIYIYIFIYTVTILTNNPPTTSNHPFLPTSPYMNYAPLSELENSHIQQRIEALSRIAEELLPGRGAMVGEFVLFQYLLHRPRQSLAWFFITRTHPSNHGPTDLLLLFA